MSKDDGGRGAVEVVNRQRGRKMDRRRWADFGGEALAAIAEVEGDDAKRAANSVATVAFVGDRTIRRLNREFRAKDRVTDVLSFPHEAEEFEAENVANLGDVVISVPQAERQAAENNLTFDEEVAQLILHGLLHLCGYDHEDEHERDAGEMNRVELRLRRRLGID